MKLTIRTGLIFPSQVHYKVCELSWSPDATKLHLTVSSFTIFPSEDPHIPISGGQNCDARGH